jgi:hypothetical protein
MKIEYFHCFGLALAERSRAAGSAQNARGWNVGDQIHHFGISARFDIAARFNSERIADFKRNGDWCKSHDLPENQCMKCPPELEAKFKAMAPK